MWDQFFFITSKIAWGLLSPASLFVGLVFIATCALLLNKTGLAKTMLFCLSMLGLGIWSYPVGDMAMYPLESRFQKPTAMPDTIDGIIILGGGERLKPSLSWDTAELDDGGDRYLATLALAKRYPETPIIFAGGSGLVSFQKQGSEGDIARRIFTGMGIAPNRLIIESNSRNTYENFVLLKSILPVRQGHYLLVTSAFHMPRSVGIARQQGINVIPYPVDYRSVAPAYRQWDFQFYEHVSVLERAWKEWLGLTVYFFTDKTSEWFPVEY